MSFDPSVFRRYASGGWGGKGGMAWRGLLQTDQYDVTGRTVINRGQIGTSQYRSTAPTITQALTGVSRDNAGAALGNCTVELYHGKKMIAGTTSDASGNFTFTNPGSGPFRILFDKPGFAGLTSETLVAV